MPQDNSSLSPRTSTPVLPNANGVNTTEGRVFTGLPYGCPKLDWRVRIENAVAFVVTYRLDDTTLGNVVWSSDVLPSLKEAQDFHEQIASGERPGKTAGVVIAIRDDGAVIGEVPTRRQEQTIIARSRSADLAFHIERFARPRT